MSSEGNGDVNMPNQGSNTSRQRNQAMAVLEYNNPDNRPDAALAIQPPPPSEGRQPQTLQEVLRYSIAATTDSTHAPIPPMDTERRAFLEASLRSFAHSAVDRMRTCIEVLLSDDTRHDQASCEQALEQIIDLVDNMDNASDFHKIGGFRVLEPGLRSVSGTVRALTATLIAELSQNNAYVQDRVLETELLSLLLDAVDSDPDPCVRVKSFYAVSCVVRDHGAALGQFAARGGWTTLLKALQSPVEKLRLKACFLLSSVCAQDPSVADDLCELGYVEQLCGLLAAEPPPPRPLVEHLLRALLAMAAGSARAVEQCSLPRLRLRRTLSDVLESADGDSDDGRYAREMKSLVFGGGYEDDGER